MVWQQLGTSNEINIERPRIWKMDLAGRTPGTSGTNALFQRNCPKKSSRPTTTTNVIKVTSADREDDPSAFPSAKFSIPAPTMAAVTAVAFIRFY